jgi:hypothetical protein
MTNAEQADMYREKSRSLRALATVLIGEQSRADLLRVADEYDRMAERAALRPPNGPIVHHRVTA